MYLVLYSDTGSERINVDAFNERDEMLERLAEMADEADNDGWEVEFVDPDNVECGSTIELANNEVMIVTGEVLGAEVKTAAKIVLS